MTQKELEEDQFVQAELNDLQYFWLPNGAPCFVANREDICDQVEGLGFQIYYIIGNQELITNTTANANKNNKSSANVYAYQQTSHKVKLFKVVKNIVGRAIGVTEEDLGKDICSFKEEAEYSLPPIPRTMVNKLDEFFRLVYAQHGTESIVILTFDLTKEGSEGWGILVPEQTNTAAHCKYDPDSVAALKEDHAIIVGSVHSHPEMSAYASGVDHEDQADFDGLHITYGWQNSVSNGMTQYHAELQMGGSNYKIDISDVFESFTIDKDPDPDVIEWTGKVKKAYPQALGGYNTTQYQGTATYSNSGVVPTLQSGITDNKSGYNIVGAGRFVQARMQNIPVQVLDAVPYNAVLVGEINTSGIGSMLCPSCNSGLFKNEIYGNACCPSCDLPLVGLNTHVESIIKIVNVYLNKRNRSLNVPFYLWSKGYANSKDHVVLLIKPAQTYPEMLPMEIALEANKDDDSLKAVIYERDDDDSYLQYDLKKELEDRAWNDLDNGAYTDVQFSIEYWSTRTWCCEVDLITSNSVVCDCAVMVMDEDAADFDEFCNKNSLTVYKDESDCEVCVHWYSGGCDGYRTGVVDYKRSKDKPFDVIVDHIEQNLNLDGCVNWEKYPSDFSHMEMKGMDFYDYTN